MAHIVALMGKRGSGKSTAAAYLVDQYGFKLRKFADPLKDMLRAIGLTDEEIEGDLKQQPCELLMGRTPVHAMQTLGTEWGRYLIHPDMWADHWIRRTQGGRFIVCDDCRFPNEARCVRANGGRIIEIIRPAKDNPLEGDQHSSHASESTMVETTPDFVVQNSGTILELGRMVYEAAFHP